MFPVFSLVLDEDVPSDIALIYPELYKDLGKVGDQATVLSSIDYRLQYFQSSILWTSNFSTITEVNGSNMTTDEFLSWKLYNQLFHDITDQSGQ